MSEINALKIKKVGRGNVVLVIQFTVNDTVK